MALHRTASDVAEMERDISLLHADNTHLRTQLEIAQSELSECRARLAVAENSAREELVRATQMETILQTTSLGLVTGLQKMKDQRAQERDARRARQLHHLEQETRDIPHSLRAGEAEAAVRAATDDAPPILAPDAPRDLDAQIAPWGPGRNLNDPGLRTKRAAPDPRDIQDAAELVGRPMRAQTFRDPPLRQLEPRTDIVDSRLPRVEMLDAGEQDIRNRAALARAVRGAERG